MEMSKPKMADYGNFNLLAKSRGIVGKSKFFFAVMNFPPLALHLGIFRFSNRKKNHQIWAAKIQPKFDLKKILKNL